MKASDLFARIKQTQEDANALKAYWESALTCAPPQDFDLKNLVRKFPLDHLVMGIEAYAAKIAKKGQAVAEGKEAGEPVTTENAKKYICATSWNLTERDDPKDRPFTERRIRNAQIDPSSADWDSASFHGAAPDERQKTMATIIARQKAKKQ